MKAKSELPIMDTQKNQQSTQAAGSPQARRSSFTPTFEGLQKQRSNSMSHAAKFDDQRASSGWLGNAWKKFTTGRDQSA
ncbi:hypothetical protein EYR41_002732 [Orbilia oligospora]|uniref:Uncharacterized protein n=1 Tax=Orbilia oligospora TaxID=2813651 RepID=A0A7C8K9U7_ORBOL|nr:hypothetical protein TWF751_008850 [Orbilia oligospora]TGJ70705.1 hypothetical protein EYR41_002732 [Orbilia oligospora]